ncbi:MAG: biotin--[acetyl-CoA-carboxylase] ligase [Muribaculaceae bacterium]|nr:biotin--[acetyl-CoA-carboxylase] ligase [Muribaculaceae bacterium]
MKHIHLDETTSTNSAIIQFEHDAPVYLTATSQTSGRGQRGNSWESEPGKNVTMSILVTPRHVNARNQFAISRAVAVAITDVINPSLATVNKQAAIKWPNDIYVDNYKVAGILIENALGGDSIIRSIIGIGLNVNQTSFVSNAPNPLSLASITGRELDIDNIAEMIATRVVELIEAIDNPGSYNSIYHSRLWRRDGEWRFVDTASGKEFTAGIDHVANDGCLHLETDSELRQYYFKEVAFIL